jgi:orotate phosphoribosyltransferase
MSSLEAVTALREAGCTVKGMMAIFSYDLPVANENFKNANVKLHTLTDYNTLVKQALRNKSISDSDMDSLAQWREDPEKWGAR